MGPWVYGRLSGRRRALPVERMLLGRHEMTFDFGQARLDTRRAEDRSLLGWVLNQLVYWQVASARGARRLERAPDIGAGRFLAERASRDLAGVESLLDALRIVGRAPSRAHPLVRRLAERGAEDLPPHAVFAGLAVGEGSLLMFLYALADLVDQRRIRGHLEAAAERAAEAVDYGERRVMDLVAARPRVGLRLAGDAFAHLYELRLLGRLVAVGHGHPILAFGPAFADRVAGSGEKRLVRLGLLPARFEGYGSVTRAAVVGGHLAGVALGGIARLPRKLLPFAGRSRRLTDVYLDDPLVRRYRLTVVSGAGSEAA